MDARQFDDLVKSLAGGATRRGVLRGLAGSVAAGALALRGGGRVAADDDCKPVGKKCNKNAQCCSGVCDRAEGRCARPVNPNICSNPPVTCEDLAGCDFETPGCPFGCGAFPDLCRCFTTTEGTSVCVGGVAPGAEQTACTSSSQCPAGSDCVSFPCDGPDGPQSFCAIPCPGPEGPFPKDFPCESDAQCQDPLVCNQYYMECEGCVPQGSQGCRRDGDCCAGLVCNLEDGGQGECVAPAA